MVKVIKRQIVCHRFTKVLDGHIKFSQFRRFHGASHLTQYFTRHGYRHSNMIRLGFCAIVPTGNPPGPKMGFFEKHESGVVSVNMLALGWHQATLRQPQTAGD